MNKIGRKNRYYQSQTKEGKNICPNFDNPKNLLRHTYKMKRIFNVKIGDFSRGFCLGSFFWWGLTQFGRTLYFALQWNWRKVSLYVKLLKPLHLFMAHGLKVLTFLSFDFFFARKVPIFAWVMTRSLFKKRPTTSADRQTTSSFFAYVSSPAFFFLETKKDQVEEVLF